MRTVQQFLMTVLLLTAAITHADSLEKASQDLCERIKQCSLAEMDNTSSSMSPQMRAMIESSINSMCDAMQKEFPKHNNHPLADSAMRCMRSMADLSCEEIKNMKQSTTPECKAYREEMEKYDARAK